MPRSGSRLQLQAPGCDGAMVVLLLIQLGILLLQPFESYFKESGSREGKLSNPRGRAARAPCREKIYGNPRARAAHAPCIDFAAAKNTVLEC